MTDGQLLALAAGITGFIVLAIAVAVALTDTQENDRD